MTNPTSSSAYPAGLAILLDKLQQAVADLTAQLEAGDLEAVEWEIGMGQLLARYSLAAYMVGADTAALTASDISNVAFIVQTQLSFLDNFTLVIQSEAEFQAGWTARAQQYAQHIVEPYWKGATRVLPLPAMPGDGTFCECRCSWSVETIDEEKGDYNATWVLGHVRTSHCAICEERAKEWNPLQIRNGRLVSSKEYVTSGNSVDEKHYPGRHDQKRHGWRFGNGGLSSDKLDKMSEGERKVYEEHKAKRSSGGDRNGLPEANASGGSTRQISGKKISTSQAVNDAITKSANGVLDTEGAKSALKRLGHKDPSEKLVSDYARQMSVLSNLEQMTGANVSGQIGKWDFSSAQSIHDSFDKYLNRRIGGQHRRYTEKYGKH